MSFKSCNRPRSRVSRQNLITFLTHHTESFFSWAMLASSDIASGLTQTYNMAGVKSAFMFL